MKRTIVLVIIAIFLQTVINVSVFAENDESSPTILINGEKIEFPISPYITSNGVTMVPFRPIFEKIGLTVNWNSSEQGVIGEKNNLKVALIVGVDLARINHQTIELESKPVIKSNYLFVPLRFIGEATGYTVNWDATSHTVQINSEPEIIFPEHITEGMQLQDFLKEINKTLLNNVNKLHLEGDTFTNPEVQIELTKRKVNKNNFLYLKQSIDDCDYDATVSNNVDQNRQTYTMYVNDKKQNTSRYGEGERFMLRSDLALFNTTTNFFKGNEFIYMTTDIDLVDFSQKKVYSISSASFPPSNDGLHYDYRLVRRIYTYNGDLKDNDYISLFFSGKKGVSDNKNYTIRSEIIDMDFGKLRVPFTFPIKNEFYLLPDLYSYELFSQFAFPNWCFNQTLPLFYLYSGDSKKTSPLTKEQIKAFLKPFKSSSDKQYKSLF